MIKQIIVYRDEKGKVVNIGEWDFMLSEIEDGTLQVNNPLPENSTSQIEDVTVNEDGSRVAVNQ